MSSLSRELPTGVSVSDRGHDVDDPGLGNKIYLAFIPWVLFTLIAQHGTLKAAAVAAAVASGAIALHSIFVRRPKLLEIGAAVTFTGFTIVALTVPSHLIAGVLDTRQGNLIVNWALPVVLIVWAAKRTAASSGAADRR